MIRKVLTGFGQRLATVKWLRDPVTLKPSITVTLIVIFGLLFMIGFMFAIFSQISWKIMATPLLPFGLVFGAYQQKRVKIGFTGVEISGGNNDQK